MVFCLNPKKPHENKDTAAQASLTCQYCKYLLEGAVLGDCRATRWIGSGAFGDVYEATQMPPLSRRVAIKVMLPERVADEESAVLFEREVGAIAALDHPNILPVLRAGNLEDGRAYLVMKYAAHGSLQQHCQLTPQGLSILPSARPISMEIETRVVIDGQTDEEDKAKKGVESSDPAETLDMTANDGEGQGGNLAALAHNAAQSDDLPRSPVDLMLTLTPQQLLPYIEDAAAALQYAHDHSLIHLDVKPANLLLDAEDRLLLADFGVSTILDGYSHASLHCYVGTPVYTAPEQWLEQPRPASDQYALAITSYQLLAGRPPFTGSLYSIMHGHLQLPPPSLRELNPLIPQQVEAVIMRGLAKEPSERYKDMRSFARAYRAALEDAANASTDVQGRMQQKDTTRVETRVLKQTTPLSSVAPYEVQSDKLPPTRRKRGRMLVALVLVALLLFGGTLGALRAFAPCLLGVCPAIRLSASEVDITNNDTQVVKITDSGTADLQWSVTNPVSAPWLVYSPSAGLLVPGQVATLTIKTSIDGLPNGVDTAQLEINGQGVNPLPLTVKLTVQTGLGQISAKVGNTQFIYDQEGIHPAAGTITITNKSDQSFNWYIEYKYTTSWLQVTPFTDTLAAGGTETLTVTANGQNLPPDTYITEFSILGSVGQTDPGILSDFQFTLQVRPSALQGTPSVTVTTTGTPTFPSLTLSAQAPASSNAPVTLRSDHSMVWDFQDDLLFIFGGIDSQGNYLNDLWSYSPVTGLWSQINPATPGTSGTCTGGGTWPAARADAAMVWDSTHSQILLYGGVGANGHYYGDLWSYSPATSAGNWTPLACSNSGPGARASNAVWNGSQMLILGGTYRYGKLADFWTYTPASNGALGAWQRLIDFPGGQRAYQTMVWDTNDNMLLTFGGVDVNGLQRNDLYSYTTKGSWTPITPLSSSNPKARQQGIAVWDSKDRVMLMMGGWNDKDPTGPYYGLWAYDPTANQWQLLTPLNSSNNNVIPGRTASAMVWDIHDQAAYIYAGAGSGKTGSTLSDLWMVTSGS
jgi:serine/threonine protein kinase